MFFSRRAASTVGDPVQKALTGVDVVQKQFLQLWCFYSVHRISAHDAACSYGIAVCVEQLPHTLGDPVQKHLLE